MLKPSWVGTCYQRLGDFKAARAMFGEILNLTPQGPAVIGAFAEVSLLEGNLDEAEARAGDLRERAEPGYQVLGRIIGAFALALRGGHDQAARELSWVGQFLISSGSVPAAVWD